MPKVDLRRIILAVLVGINLTLMCQGHDQNGQHIGPHLTVRDVFDHMDGAAMAAPASTVAQHMPAAHAHLSAAKAHAAPLLEYDVSCSPEQHAATPFSPNIIRAAYTGAPDAPTLYSFASASLLASFFALPPLRSVHLAALATISSDFVPGLEPPPPRPAASIL